jgi:hypothetical protein
MVKNKLSFNSNKRIIAVTAASLLVASIAAIGAAQLSDQQTPSSSSSLRIGRGVITSALIADETIVSADLKDGAAVRSSDIVDGQVNTADLASNAVTSDKIKNGEVKAEDLDPSIDIGGGGETPSFSPQVTERSNSITIGNSVPSRLWLSVQCNSDEVVTGGGFSVNPGSENTSTSSQVSESKKLDNGWTASWNPSEGETLVVYAECLKIVNEGTTSG